MDKCKTIWLISIFIFLMLIVNYRVRENFTEDTEVILADFLNTQKMQTDEVSRIFSVDGDKMKTEKALHFNDKATIVRGNDDVVSNDLGLYSQPNGAWMRFVTQKGPIKFYTDGEAGKRIGGSPAVEIIDSNLSVRNDIRAPHIYADNFVKIDKHTGHNGSGTLCIKDNTGEVCIDADHLRMLKGEKDIFLKSIKKNKYLNTFANRRTENEDTGSSSLIDHKHLIKEIASFEGGGKNQHEKMRIER